jgi:phage gp29-like protein
MIVDIYGNPIQKPAELAERQTAAPALQWLTRTYQNHPARGLTPARLASILRQAEESDIGEQSDLWLDVREKWGHCDAEMGRRERALLTLDWSIVPPDGANRAEKKAAALVQDVLENLPQLDDVILGCADAIGHGFSAQELRWEREGAEWRPLDITHQPHHWFQLDLATRREIRLRDGTADGAMLRPFGWILHLHKARSGYVSRAGLVRSLAWPYLFANFSIRDLAELLEIFGIPIRIGKHPANATPEEKRKLLQAVVGIGHNAGGVVPDSMAIEIIQAGAGSSGDVFKLMVEWAESTASRIITGQDNRDGRTATQSLERQEIRADLRTTDARQVQRTLTGALCWPLVALNVAGVDRRRCPRFEFDTREAEDIKMLADSLPKLVAVGMQIPASWVNDKTKIPLPEEGEEVLKPAAPVQVPAVDAESQKSVNQPSTAAAKAQMTAATAKAEESDPTPVTAYSDQLADRAAAPLKDWLEIIHSEVERAKSLEALRDRLLGMYGDLPSEEMAAVMTTAFACAELAGRFDVRRGG